MAVVTAPLLELDAITLRFGGITALSGVGLSVQDHELLALIGPNGAGKTSLLNVISGVYRPSEGAIRHRGEDITAARPPVRAERGIGRTFQNLELFPGLTTIENILTGRHRHLRAGVLAGGAWFGRARGEETTARRDAERIVEFLDLEPYRTEPVASLPYGVQKRVELGRALAVQPELLLLDEPVAGMNSQETEDLGRVILDIKEELRITQILVEHDLRVVMDLADRVAVLDFGQLLAVGSPDAIHRDPAVIDAYLGPALSEEGYP